MPPPRPLPCGLSTGAQEELGFIWTNQNPRVALTHTHTHTHTTRAGACPLPLCFWEGFGDPPPPAIGGPAEATVPYILSCPTVGRILHVASKSPKDVLLMAEAKAVVTDQSTEDNRKRPGVRGPSSMGSGQMYEGTAGRRKPQGGGGGGLESVCLGTDDRKWYPTAVEIQLPNDGSELTFKRKIKKKLSIVAKHKGRGGGGGWGLHMVIGESHGRSQKGGRGARHLVHGTAGYSHSSAPDPGHFGAKGRVLGPSEPPRHDVPDQNLSR